MNRDSCVTDQYLKTVHASKRQLCYGAVLLIALIGCSDKSDRSHTTENGATPTAQAAPFKEIGWNDLMPESRAPIANEGRLPDPNAIAALAHSQMAADGAEANPDTTTPDTITSDSGNSAVDSVSSRSAQSALSAESDAFAMNDATSAMSYNMNDHIVPELNGKKVKVPGFVVPIDINDQQVTTKFFLVPYFGACIHVPPPAPNQIIYVNYPKGLTLEALYQPYWIKGTLLTGMISNEIATALYVIHAEEYELYALQ